MPEEKGPPRIKFFVGLTLFVFALLVLRLGFLQVARGDKLAAQAERNYLRLVRINAPRGVFYDRNRVPLATSRLAFSLIAVPEALADPGRELAHVARLLDIPVPELEKRLANPGRRPYEGVALATNLDQTATLRLAEAEAELPGMMLQEMPVRYYPQGEYAAHLFGYVGEISAQQLAERKALGYRMGQIVGQDGLEKVYDGILQGVDGGRLVEVDHQGVARRTVGYRDPVPGDGLVLTIQDKLQKAAETALAEQLQALRASGLAPEADAGAVVALDPRTGEILAMSSQPGFDPNVFVGGIRASEYRRLAADERRPFTNRVVAGEFPAGSTFKAVTGLAALTENKTTLADRFFCDGYDPVYAKKKCWTVGKREPHGWEDIVDGFKNSCNIVFYDLGRRLGPDKLAQYARMFGLGAPTGIGLPGERKGLVPDTAWKRQVFHDRWYFPETMDFAIGQGFLNMTPIQLAQIYMAIANGGTIYRPQLVRAVVDPAGKVKERFRPEVSRRLSLDAKALEIVRRGLSAVTDKGGTAFVPFRDLPVKVAGKTGTAQTSKGPSHGWFAGMLPAEDPRLVVVVLVEHGTSGSLAAAPVARKVFDAFLGRESSAQAAEAVSAGETIGD
ncbi:MAG: penicillin-binding protein 2 [Bacteroidota bacterium]